MRRMVAVCLGLCLAGAWASSVSAQETIDTQFEFVRKLRAKGFASLAMEYLDEMAKNKDAEIAKRLPLERSRTMVSLAREKEPSQRGPMIEAARTQLEDFIKTNQGKAEGSLARLELARVVLMQAQGELGKAYREEDAKAQEEKARRSEGLFMEAGKQLEVAAKELEAANNMAEATQAKFDRAFAYMEQSKTYIDTNSDKNNRKRAEIREEAKKIFETLSKEDEPSVSLLATAWLVKVYQDGQDPPQAAKNYTRVMTSTGPAAVPAQRLAQYFRISWTYDDPDNKKKFTKATDGPKYVQTETKKWMKTYANALKTPEGEGIRYEYAVALLSEAKAISKDLKDAKVQPIIAEAQTMLAELSDSESDIGEKASQLKTSISLTRVGENAAIDDLKTFENLLLRSQFEIFKYQEASKKLGDAAGKDKEKWEKAEKTHLHDSIRALKRALAVADDRTPIGKVDEAQWLLMSAYRAANDPARSAIAGEALARMKPPTKNSSKGAAYALETYASINASDPNEGNRQRVVDLADFVLSPEQQKIWSGDSVTGYAHYQLAMLHQKDDNFKEAIAHLEKLPKDFPAYTYAQGQLVFIALEGKEKTKSPEEKKKFVNAAIQAIKRTPAPTPGTDGTTALMYCFSQLEYPKFLYSEAAELLNDGKLPQAEAKYKEMSAAIDKVEKTIEAFAKDFKGDRKESLETAEKALRKYAKLGAADIGFRQGKVDEVLNNDFLKSVVKEVRGGAPKEGAVKVADPDVTSEIFSLWIRANVQKGAIDEAKQSLDLVKRLKGAGDTPIDTNRLLGNLLTDLQSQVKELERAKKKDDLRKLTENYSKLIDELATGVLAQKKVDPGQLVFLARFYASLNQHDKAGKLFGRFPEPPALALKEGTKVNEDQEKELQTYWYFQIEAAKEHRLNGKEVKEDLAIAKKLLDRLKAHPQARLQTLADIEQIHLMEDSGDWGKAVVKWGDIMKAVQGRIAEDPKLKEIYFDAYFNYGRTMFMFSQTPKVKEAKKDAKYLDFAANHFVKLQFASSKEGWELISSRVEALIQEQPILKATYEKFRNEREKAKK
jgi:hypothetical protein